MNREDGPLYTLLAIFAALAASLWILLGVLALCGAFGDQHKGQHCVTKQLVHHAKVGNRWDCTKWAKNS